MLTCLFCSVGLKYMRSVLTKTKQTLASQRYRKISIWKDALQHASRNCKLKQGDATTYLLEWPKPRKHHTTKCWPRCGITGILIHCWQKCNCTATSGHSLAVSYKTKHKRCRNYVRWFFIQMSCKQINTKICTQGLTATLFINAKTWKQPRCTSEVNG